MFTIVLGIVGLFVFVFSLFTVKFKKAFIRLTKFVFTGIVLDIVSWIAISIIVFATSSH